MQELLENLKLSSDIQMDCGVPKLHCCAHKLECQCWYSLNIQPGMGRTDGESIERVWAIMNGCASSTKEMGPGSCHDTLDCHFNYLNWTKRIMFGMSMACSDGLIMTDGMVFRASTGSKAAESAC